MESRILNSKSDTLTEGTGKGLLQEVDQSDELSTRNYESALTAPI